jgi:hypothetical protein
VDEINKMENERLIQMYGVKDSYGEAEVEEMVKQLEEEGAYRKYDIDTSLVIDV